MQNKSPCNVLWELSIKYLHSGFIEPCRRDENIVRASGGENSKGIRPPRQSMIIHRKSQRLWCTGIKPDEALVLRKKTHRGPLSIANGKTVVPSGVSHKPHLMAGPRPSRSWPTQNKDNDFFERFLCVCIYFALFCLFFLHNALGIFLISQVFYVYSMVFDFVFL